MSPIVAQAAPASPLTGPSNSVEFGGKVMVLSNGNYVVVDSLFDVGASTEAGAVYLYNGLTNSLISTVTGTTTGDQIGSDGVTEVGTSDFVILSSSWQDDTGAEVGAATWVDGTTGLTGTVSAANSLVGTTAGDFVEGAVTALTNGNYVVSNPKWDGSAPDVGAVTWASGAGLTGTVSEANSLVGTTAGDNVGIVGTDLLGGLLGGVTPLINGNYVLASPNWDGAVVDAGAVTWATGYAPTSGAVSPSDSIIGATASDMVGDGGVTALTNGNYAIASPDFDNGLIDVGAATWGDGRQITSAVVAAGNSLIGVKDFDNVGSGGIAALTNGDYVVASPNWDRGPVVGAGAVTWASGTAATSAVVATSNSLVGGASFDNVGFGGVTALSNDNYVVSSPFWTGGGGGILEAGAVTWRAAGPSSGTVSTFNSLVGASASDNVGFGGVVALAGNGNYVVSSPFWNNGGAADVGAATWVNGSGVVSLTVTAANSLVGTTVEDPQGIRAADHVGNGGVTALSDGNYVVSSLGWNGSATATGAATWGNGATGAVVGPVTSGNSLVGSQLDDNVGSGGIIALAGGNYVVTSPLWSDAVGVEPNDNGAASYGPAGGALVGAITVANSAIGDAQGRVGEVRSASAKLTHANAVLVATTQNQILRFLQTDFQPPAIVQGDITVSGGDQVVTFAPFAVDNVDGVLTPVCAPASGSTFVVGVTSVSCTATDAALPVHNTTTKTFDVTVLAADVAGPVLTLPADITVATDPGLTTAAVSYTATATDPSGVASIGCTPTSGSVFPLGVTVVSCTATDLAAPPNTTGPQTFTVTVKDQENPVLVGMPANIVVGAAPGSTTKAVTYTPPTATDNIGTPTVACLPASGSVFPLGVNTVTCIATDTAVPANTDSKTFTITVNDLEPPVIAPHANITVSAAPGATSKTVDFALPSATDNQGVQSVVCDKASGSSFPVGVTTVGCTATDLAGLKATTSFTVTVSTQSDYVSLSPGRLADSRSGGSTVDGLFAGDGIHAAGSTLQLTVANRGGVSADAIAVALNVTAVDATGDGFVTVFPCGSDQPTASNLNFTAGSITPNAVIAKVGAAGKICIFVSAPTHLVVDVNGFFPPTSSLHSLNPARVLETRSGLPTVDGQQQGEDIRTSGSTTAVQITGRATVPADATGAVLNVTVTEAQGPGFATVYPCGASVPTASSINFVAGVTVANLVVSKIGDGGAVCVFTSQAAQVVVDVAGYFPVTTSYHSLVPARLMDTRKGQSTIDGLFLGAGPIEAGEVTELQVTKRGGVPVGAGTVVLNVTATETGGAGFLTVYPCGITTPLASNLNFVAGGTVANAVIVKVGDDGKVCLFNSKASQLVVDVNGFFPV